MKKPDNVKERGLIKGAMRRVFSRSELRRQALNTTAIDHSDPLRPKVTKWGFCSSCGLIEARYKLEVDHVEPLVPLDKSLEDMDWDEVVDRLWCDGSNLAVVCKDCHKSKSKAENKERRLNKGKNK